MTVLLMRENLACARACIAEYLGEIESANEELRAEVKRILLKFAKAATEESNYRLQILESDLPIVSVAIDFVHQQNWNDGDIHARLGVSPDDLEMTHQIIRGA